jgi:hypothetical protein
MAASRDFRWKRAAVNAGTFPDCVVSLASVLEGIAYAEVLRVGVNQGRVTGSEEMQSREGYWWSACTQSR